MKICSKCKSEKNNFAKGHSECKECNKKYKASRKEEIKKKSKEYYLKNKIAIDKNNKQYQVNNKDTLIEYRFNYRSDNRVRNNEYNKKYRKNRYANDPQFRVKIIVSSMVYNCLRKNSISKNRKSISKYLSYSMKELKLHLELQFEPWMTWDNHGKYDPKTWDNNDVKTWTWQIDHLIPQAILPYTSMEDDNFKKCWMLGNLRPLSAKKNVLEGNRREFND